uniref:Putative importin-7 n=1 Tax=Tetraselmis sp. GSL018 TaxID=582737 RepID=A0A061RWK7_9CHLO
MDLQQLVVTLQHCLSSNPNERQAAEQALTQHQHAKGQIVNLLRASVEDGVEETVRQVAAISFKNAIKRGWDSTEEDGQPRRFDDEDKAVVRSHLLEAIIRAPPKIKVQLGECLKSIVYSDYPEKWPDLLGGVVENMKSAEQARLHGALYALRILARKYEFKDKDERGPLGMVINNSFPMLLQIFQAILSEGSRNVEVAELIKLICKTFWSSTFMSMPACLADHDQFVGWMTCIHTFINMPVPEEGMPEDLDARMSWPWWKAKKWVLHISNRLLTRYSDPAICSVPEEQAFATMFSQECLPKFVESVLHMLAGLLHGRWLPPRSINLALHFLTSCIPRAETYKIIKPHLNELLANVVFPILCFDDTDAELWANDPHEYIRKGYDVIEEMYNPRTAAMNFLHEVCKVRPKMSLDFFMAHVARCFGAYLAADTWTAPC